MAKFTKSVTTYHFNPPPIISEKEFLVLKQIFKENSSHKIAPKYPFWDKFPAAKWCSIIFISLAAIEYLVNHSFSFLAIYIWIVMMSIFTGLGDTMESYYDFISAKNKYYKILKKTIIISNTYTEFVHRISILYT